jgi:Cu/Ag efflux protein CusF
MANFALTIALFAVKKVYSTAKYAKKSLSSQRNNASYKIKSNTSASSAVKQVDLTAKYAKKPQSSQRIMLAQ